MEITITKELEDNFEILHQRCVDETRELGKATYETHGKRCEALARISERKEMLILIDEHIKDHKENCFCGITKDIEYPITTRCGNCHGRESLEEFRKKLTFKLKQKKE